MKIFFKDAISKEKNWLKDLKESIGNTEANSLKQVNRINEFGLFDFGLRNNSNLETLVSFKNITNINYYI